MPRDLDADDSYVEEYLLRTRVHGPVEPVDLWEPEDYIDVAWNDSEIRGEACTVTREQYHQERAA